MIGGLFDCVNEYIDLLTTFYKMVHNLKRLQFLTDICPVKNHWKKMIKM